MSALTLHNLILPLKEIFLLCNHGKHRYTRALTIICPGLCFHHFIRLKKNTHSCQKVQLNSMIEKKSKISSLKLIHFHQWKSTRPRTSFLRRFMAESLRSGIFKVWKLRLISETMHTMGANNINILKKRHLNWKLMKMWHGM